MNKSGPALAYQDMFIDLVQKAQKTMINHWNNPLEYAFDSIFGITELTSNAFDQLMQHQNDAFSFYLDTPSAGTSTRQQNQIKQSMARRTETSHVAVVTGGIGGIGTEICKQLFDAGHQVIATYMANEQERARVWQDERKAEGYDIDIAECDVTDFESCKKMSKRLEIEYNRIDILVNCAGITRDATLRKMDIENWHAVLDTNLDSVFNVTRNFINGMIKRGYGRIINISSVNGQKGQFGQTNYSTAKAGIIGFSKSLALELADCGITVNTVCPGYVGTSMVEAIPDDVINSIIAKIPVGRLAKPAEVAAAVIFLAAENSGYITGSEISINGGLFTGIS